MTAIPLSVHFFAFPTSRPRPSAEGRPRFSVASRARYSAAPHQLPVDLSLVLIPFIWPCDTKGASSPFFVGNFL